MESLVNLRSFILVLLSVIGLFLLAFFKGVDISMSLPTLVSMYVLSKVAGRVSDGWASSKDPNADTNEAIDKNKNLE